MKITEKMSKLGLALLAFLGGAAFIFCGISPFFIPTMTVIALYSTFGSIIVLLDIATVSASVILASNILFAILCAFFAVILLGCAVFCLWDAITKPGNWFDDSFLAYFSSSSTSVSPLSSNDPALNSAPNATLLVGAGDGENNIKGVVPPSDLDLDSCGT